MSDRRGAVGDDERPTIAGMQAAVEVQHECHAVFRDTVKIRTECEGDAWAGEVLVFDLADHPTAKTDDPTVKVAYAWRCVRSDPGPGDDRRRFYSVLHEGPVYSPESAVRAAMGCGRGRPGPVGGKQEMWWAAGLIGLMFLGVGGAAFLAESFNVVLGFVLIPTVLAVALEVGKVLALAANPERADGWSSLRWQLLAAGTVYLILMGAMGSALAFRRSHKWLGLLLLVGVGVVGSRVVMSVWLPKRH